MTAAAVPPATAVLRNHGTAAVTVGNTGAPASSTATSGTVTSAAATPIATPTTTDSAAGTTCSIHRAVDNWRGRAPIARSTANSCRRLRSVVTADTANPTAANIGAVAAPIVSSADWLPAKPPPRRVSATSFWYCADPMSGCEAA